MAAATAAATLPTGEALADIFASLYYDPDTQEVEWDDEVLADLVPEPAVERGFESVIVIDDLPVASEKTFEKLVLIIKQKCAQYGEVVNFDMPMEDGKTQGFCFVEYAKTSEARKAVEKLNGFVKKPLPNPLKVVPFSQFEQFEYVPEEYVEPKIDLPDSIEELQSWLVDPREADQFLQTAGVKNPVSEIIWNDASALGSRPHDELDVAFVSEFQAHVLPEWSPRGTYLLTLHGPGVQLWGGPDFKVLHRIEHVGVRLFQWSPDERYLVTASPEFKNAKGENNCIIIWEVLTGKLMRGFDFMGGGAWPVFTWSADDKLFAKACDVDMQGKFGDKGKVNTMQVYSTADFKLLDGRSFVITDVQAPSFAPALAGSNLNKRMLAYWTPEVVPENPTEKAKPKAGKSKGAAQPVVAPKPANVTIIELPSRQIVQAKNAQRVSSPSPMFKPIVLHWHPDGRFLCSQFMRHNKAKTKHFSVLEIFRTLERGVPVETVAFDGIVLAFAWEPQGNRFAVLHTSDIDTLKSGGRLNPDVTFYDLSEGKVTKLKTLTERQCTDLVWSPTGGNIILAGLQQMGGVLEFFNVDMLETMSQQQHHNCHAVRWDPTGRYVVSVVSHWTAKHDNGYVMFSFNGRKLRQLIKDEYLDFVWRPRPPTLLTPAELDQLQADLPNLAKAYRERDAQERRAEQAARRKQLEERTAELEELLAARARPMPEIKYEYVDEWVMELAAPTQETPL